MLLKLYGIFTQLILMFALRVIFALRRVYVFLSDVIIFFVYTIDYLFVFLYRRDDH